MDGTAGFQKFTTGLVVSEPIVVEPRLPVKPLPWEAQAQIKGQVDRTGLVVGGLEVECLLAFPQAHMGYPDAGSKISRAVPRWSVRRG
jgi:hypothetical protein